jgi:hypothetical protein
MTISPSVTKGTKTQQQKNEIGNEEMVDTSFGIMLSALATDKRTQRKKRYSDAGGPWT